MNGLAQRRRKPLGEQAPDDVGPLPGGNGTMT